MRLRFLILASSLILPLSMNAETVYNYTGADFTNFNVNGGVLGTTPPAGSPYTTSSHLTGELTFSTPLAANLSGASVTPESYSFSDGAQTITDATDNNSPFFLVSTNASGNITSYVLNATSNVNANDWFTAQTIPAGSSPADNVKIQLGANVYAAITDTNGSFAPAVTATPEPSSLALLGSGLAGIAFNVRRRMRRS